MRRRDSRLLALSLSATLWALSAFPVAGTTYSLIADADLALQAPVVVQATILASEPAPTPSPPSTDTFIQVERVLKGYVAGSTVVVRVLGGISPSGAGLKIWGAPVFRAGERVILFLTPRSDGTYSPLHLALGVFHEIQAGSRRLAVRDLVGAVEVIPGGGLGIASSDRAVEPVRDFEAFVTWLAEIGNGGLDSTLARAESYRVRAADLPDFAATIAHGRLEETCTGLGFRWFEFDRGRRVKWSVDPRGIRGAGTGKAEFEHARSVWRRASDNRIRLSRGGETMSRSGLAVPDGINALLFNDPADRIPGGYDCAAGGILAVTGIWYENGRNQECQVIGVGEKGRIGDRAFLRIQSADIVTNDGSACYLASGPVDAAEVFAHELGHSLGLPHLGEAEALMRGLVHDDARGPRLDEVDRSALERLYPPPD